MPVIHSKGANLTIYVLHDKFSAFNCNESDI